MKPIVCETIKFSGESVNVRVYSVVQAEAEVRLHTLHSTCASRVSQVYVCNSCDAVVPKEEQVKGYEYTRNEYVVVADDEVSACSETSRGIELISFFPPSAVSTLYHSKAYYVGPDHGAERRFARLVTAMRDTGRDALAWWRTRGKKHLVVLSPHGDVVVMQQLHFCDTVRDAAAVGVEHIDLARTERQEAARAVMEMAVDTIDLSQYGDDVRGRVVGMLTEKVSAQESARMKEKRPA